VGRVLAEELREALRNRRERELRFETLALRAPEMARENRASATGEDRANRRQARLDPPVVRDNAAIHRDISHWF
jgi:hypothetical protein